MQASGGTRTARPPQDSRPRGDPQAVRRVVRRVGGGRDGGRMTRPPTRTASLRHARRAKARRIAADQAGAVSRSQLYAAGLTRGELRANVRAGRWQRIGRHVVVLHTGPLEQATILWAAQLSGGPRARLDGAS